MTINLKTLLCCVFSLLFLAGAFITVFADGDIIVDNETESVTDEELTEESSTVEDESSSEESEIVRLGDVNIDGKISAADARLALRIAARLEPDATDAQLIAADVITDGRVEAKDARHILRVSAKLEDESSFGKA